MYWQRWSDREFRARLEKVGDGAAQNAAHGQRIGRVNDVQVCTVPKVTGAETVVAGSPLSTRMPSVLDAGAMVNVFVPVPEPI